MDFLDPKKNLQNKALLYIGYFLIAIAIGLLTLILVFEAYGYGFGKDGSVVQSGLIYLSSQPNPANIYINGQLSGHTTNTRITLPEGIYKFNITDNGYKTWSRTIEIDGGVVVHYDYPLLIPNKLASKKVKTYSALPELATESLNRQLLLVQVPGSNINFDLYNLTAPASAPTQISMPANLISTATVSESYQVVAWANDNQHVLLSHTFDGKTEYILMDVANPSQSVNLSQSLSSQSFSAITFDNEQYDQYYLYNVATKTLETDTLSTPTSPTPVLSNVLAYNTYLTNTVVYATTTGAPAGKVYIDVLVGNQNYHIKTFNAGTTYLLDMASYNGTIYVAAGAASENKVYVYRDPVSQLQADSDQAPIPSQVLFVNNPTYLSFSDTAQFIAAEGGQQFGVYDIDNDHGYNYTSTYSLDSPQAHASWMDGDRLVYVSGGKVVMFDYDDNYPQVLAASSSQFVPFFTPTYNYLYTVAPEANAGAALLQTSLLANP